MAQNRSQSRMVSQGDKVVERLPVNDLNFSTFLYGMGYEIVSMSVDRSDIEVVFKNVPERMILDYANDALVVPPRRILDAFKDFRSLTRTIGRSTGSSKMPPPLSPPIPSALAPSDPA